MLSENGVSQSFEASIRPQRYTFSNKITPPYTSQTVLPNIEQRFKYVEAILIQTKTISNNAKKVVNIFPYIKILPSSIKKEVIMSVLYAVYNRYK